MQDLSGFKVPGGFRGGGAIKVQLWWAVHFYYGCLAQK